jgi:hypothetical protein
MRSSSHRRYAIVQILAVSPTATGIGSYSAAAGKKAAARPLHSIKPRVISYATIHVVPLLGSSNL